MARRPSGWPSAGHELLRELCVHAGRLALVLDDDDFRVMQAFEDLAGGTTMSAGLILTQTATPPEPAEVAPLLSSADRLVDLDLLFWRPGLGVDPIALLRQLGRVSGRSPLALWPGAVKAGVVTYSLPGRRDHYHAALEDAVVLRPRATPFPDDVPYEIERY